MSYDNTRYDQATYAGAAQDPVAPITGVPVLSLYVDAVNWTSRTAWKSFKMSFRRGVGVAATFELDVTGVTESAPGCNGRFTLTLPTGEIFVLQSVGTPKTLYRTDGIEIIVTYTYETIDIISALDRVPLPRRQFIESNAGEIISTLIAAMDASINTSGVATGNDVPYLDTTDYAKFSDVVKADALATGGYLVQVDPTVNGGFAVVADYLGNFGASGIAVDKTSHDFSPSKDDIVPDTNVINYQRVKSSKPGPHHTVCEFRELDATVPSFKLKTLPYGLDGTELINYQIDDGNLTAAESAIESAIANGSSPLPNIVPLHYPVQIEIADISLSGAGEIGAFIGRGGVTALSCLVGGNYIGANVGGSSSSLATPFATGAPAADTDHQFYYDWYAFFSSGGLEVRVVENYLNNLAGETALATVASFNQSAGTISLTLTGVATSNELPNAIRFFAAGDPDTIRGYSTIKERNGSTITIDNWPAGIIVGDSLANGDSATVVVTEKVVYSGAGPSSRYGKPQLVLSGASGVTARQWTASYGPAIDATLLANPYTGTPGRRLRVDTVASRSTDMVISASGNTAVCTFVSDRLPLTGDIRLILNYDAAKIVDIVVQDTGSQALCGIRQGAIITSDAVLTADEATALGQAVLDDFADQKPTGTITRESWLTSAFPMPGYTVSISEPSEYRIADTTVPISDVSVNFGGYDWEANEGVLIYQISIGNLDSTEAVKRKLLAEQNATGLAFRPLSAPGARISGATWNDTDTVTLSISGSIAINGKPASSSFNPVDYVSGNFREGPVSLAGTTSGAETGELLVEIIYPPLDIDAASETCTYSPHTNLITYRWGRAPGAISYLIERLLDDGTGTGTLVYKQVDEIFSESYPLPYEPNSRTIKVLVSGLAGKTSAGGYITLQCTLPPLPAPTTFQITPGKAVKPSGRIPFLVSAPPSGQYAGRAQSLLILLTKTPVHTPPTVRADFVNTDTNLVSERIDVQGITEATRQVVYYEEWQPGDSLYVTAMWVDRFGQEGAIAAPFDVLHPPVTVGSITLVDFFQSATQANGGTIADDNEATPQVELTGKFRVHLGNHISAVKIWFDESAAISNGGAYSADSQFTSHQYDVTDQDVLNGYCAVICKQRFRWTKKKKRKYRPNLVTFIGPNVRTRVDGTGAVQNTHEKRFLVGYTGSAPPIVPHVVDAVFDKSTFEFQPGINGLGSNFTVVSGVQVQQRPEAFKVFWQRFPDDASVRRYLVLVHTANFGAKGPGSDATIGTALDLIQTDGTLTVYEPTNTTKNTLVNVIDAGDVGRHTFRNGDPVGGLTITQGATYFVAVIAQLQNGRYSTDFSTVVNSTAGGPTPPTDTAVPSSLSAPSFAKVKKNGTHLRMPLPGTNAITHAYNQVVIASAAAPANGVKVLTAADLSTTTTLTSTNDAAGRIDSGRKKTTIEIDKSALEALFGIGATIFFYYYAINGVGSSLQSPALSYNLATGEASALGADSAAPGAVVINRAKIKKGAKLILDWVLPTSQMNTHTKNVLVIHDNNVTGTGRKVFDLNTSTWVAAYPDGTTEISLAKGDGNGMPISPVELFVGGRTTVFIRIGVYNQFNGGSATYSGDTTTSITQSGSEKDDIPGDTSSALAMSDGTLWSAYQPTISWFAKALHIQFDLPAVQVNSMRKVFVLIHDNSGHALKTDLSGGATITSLTIPQIHAAGCMFRVGKSGTVSIPVKRKTLINALGIGASLFCSVYIYTDFTGTNVTTTSPAPSGLSNNAAPSGVGSLSDVFGSYDAINVVDVGVSLITPTQQAPNGDFLFQGSSSTFLNYWFKSNAGPAASPSPDILNTAPSDPFYWDAANHAVKYQSSSWSFYGNWRKRLVKGDFYAISFIAKTDGSFGSGSLLVDFCSGTDTSICLVRGAINLAQLTTSYQLFGIVVQLDSTSNYLANNFFRIATTGTLSTTNNVVFDKLMIVRGKQFAAFSPRTLNFEGDGSSYGGENINIASMNAVASPDLGNPSGGLQGGGIPPGGGGVIIPSTL